jgi:hypothetical protein
MIFLRQIVDKAQRCSDVIRLSAFIAASQQ